MKRLLIILLFWPLVATAQFRGDGDLVLEADYLKSFILKHKATIEHLITGHPEGLRFSIYRKTYGKEAWQARYNYPEVGVTLAYIDYQDERLGKVFGVMPNYQFYLTKNQQSKSQFSYKVGLGLGFHTQKYHHVENNKNNALSTTINFGVLFEFAHAYTLNEKLTLRTSLALTHFSNGSIKQPNSGINTISANIGLRYRLNDQKSAYLVPENEQLEKNIGYSIIFSSGVHEAVRKGGGALPFYVFSALVDKTLNYKSKMGLMLDWFHSRSLKREVHYDQTLDGETPDFNRVGLGLSHELVVGTYSVLTQAGYYIYAPYEPYEPIYFRIGLRKHFTEKLFGSFSIKSHYARAEAAEFAIGWRFK